MNLGMVTSTVVAGVLLIAMLALNMRVSQESDSTVMNQITKSNLNSITDIVEYDFRKVGYKAADPKILTANATTFTFKADLEDNGTVDEITWQLTSDGVASTKNPNDRIVQRIKNGNTTDIKMGVTDFELTYYTADNSTTTDPAKIRSIKLFLEVQSPAPIDGEYVTTSWQKQFAPWNLQN